MGARIDPDGNVEVFNIGVVDPASNLLHPPPVWPNNNPYGQKKDTPVIVDDDDGNIVDPYGKILTPILEGMSPWDGLYKKGDELPNGKSAKKKIQLYG